MDLGIKGRSAVVCASSQGLGLACAAALAREGCTVFINGRNHERLLAAQARIETETGVLVATVTADITTDLATLAETAEAAMPALITLRDGGGDPACLEDLAFFHVIGPWRSRGLPALADVLRWLGEIIREHEEW